MGWGTRNELGRGLFVAAVVGSTACSLLVDTTGLVGRDEPTEAGSEAAADAGVDTGVDVVVPEGGVDAQVDAFSCDGGLVTRGWSAFGDKNAGITIDGDVLRSTVSTNMPNQTVSSRVILAPAPIARRVRVAYDLTFQVSPRFYFEPGCTVLFLASGDKDLARHLPYVSNSDFGEYMNKINLVGDYDLNQRKVGVVTTTPTKHHFEISAVANGKNLAVDTTIDGIPRHLDLALFDAVEHVVMFCGIVYGSQTTEAGSTSTTITMEAFEADVCP